MDRALKEIPGIDYNFTRADGHAARRGDLRRPHRARRQGVRRRPLGPPERKADEIRDVIAGGARRGGRVGRRERRRDAGRARARSSSPRTLRAERGRRARRRRDGDRRHRGHRDHRRTQAIPGRRAASGRVSRNARGHRPNAASRTPSGGHVTLSQVARVRVVEGPELINHENGERMVIVQSNVRGRDLGGFAADVQRAVAERVRCPTATSSPTAASSRISSARWSVSPIIVPVRAAAHRRLPVCELRQRPAGAARHAQRAVRAGRRHRRALAARAESQPQRLGRVHRAVRRGGAQRRRAAVATSTSCATRAGRSRRPYGRAQRCGSARC